MSEVIFPRIERVTVAVPSALRARFEAFIEEKQWTPEEGVKILLAYGADAVMQDRRTAEDAYGEWAAARAELSALRHRAYLADQAIRTLKMNIAGLEASNAQFECSLSQQRARQDRLRQLLADPASRPDA